MNGSEPHLSNPSFCKPVFLRVTHRGEDRITGEKLVIKQLELSQGNVPPWVDKEVAVMKMLESRYVPKLIDVILTPERLFLLEEPCETTLTTLLHSQVYRYSHISLEKMSFMLVQCLCFYHSKEIAHCALTTDCFVFNEAGEAKVRGWAYAKWGNSDQYREEIIPISRFSAPEIVGNAGKGDKWSDVWSLACILFELAAGKPLFPIDSSPEEMVESRSVITRDLDTFYRKVELEAPGQSKEWVELLAGMMKWEPVERATASEALSSPYFAMSHSAANPNL